MFCVFLGRFKMSIINTNELLLIVCHKILVLIFNVIIRSFYCLIISKSGHRHRCDHSCVNGSYATENNVSNIKISFFMILSDLNY